MSDEFGVAGEIVTLLRSVWRTEYVLETPHNTRRSDRERWTPSVQRQMTEFFLGIDRRLSILLIKDPHSQV